ncbi:MAG TPA: elongation factor G [Pseudacidobacterium sp.]|jgi:elongation factor G|nr:elongation factor G [Pseudacidobacterium sp.]
MKTYQGSEIRNVAVVGHAHSGKTTLVSALLHAANMTPTQGSVADGSATTAYDEEDVARATTMLNAVAFAEWNGVKVNFIDTPGFHMFVHEARAAMLPAEAALVVINAASGPEAMTDRVWHYADEFNLPRVVVINQMDHLRAEWQKSLESMRERYGRHLIPVQLPIVDSEGFHGVVDLATMEAFFYSPNGDGHGKIGDIPASMAADAKSAHETLVELVAEGKDELMEEFFAEGTIPEQHLITALHEAIREDRIFPVLFSSGGTNVATDHLLDFLKVYAPAPIERAPVAARAVLQAVAAHGNGSVSESNPEIVMRRVDNEEPLALYVYKTMTDPFAGRITFFKVFSGHIRNDATVTNYSRKGSEKFCHLSIMQGRAAVPVAELHAGDLGAVAKLKDTFTRDTLGDRGHEIFFEPVTMPDAAMTYAIEPKTRADEDKLAPAMHKLMEEDLLVHFYRDPQTSEFLIAGAGQPHIESLVSKLRKRYHTEVTLKSPKVPYRETIRGRADAQGRHKKQTGGHGQYGDCKIKMEPLARGGGFEFVNDIFGGAIPRQFVPAVEKGIQEAAVRGYLAGYPVVDFKVTVYDGSYHDVDSNELSFKLAGRLAFRKCMEQAKPVLLEPIMQVEIEAPDAFAGALMGDLNQRRGRVQGMESQGATTSIRAEVPMAEMLTYGQNLTAMTQGRGSFHMEMDHYDIVPQALADKIIANAKKPQIEEEE